jgi:hypothetical protein
MPRIYRASDGMSVDCRGGYLVLFGTNRFSESERLRGFQLTLLTRFVKESCFSDKSVVTMATGIVNTLFSGVHEQ